MSHASSVSIRIARSDCSMTGSPDVTPRQGVRNLPTWNLNSDLEDETLVKAFETYKKKDSSKGT